MYNFVKKSEGDFMYCQKCGREILDEAVVCPHCGCMVNGKRSPVATENAKVSGLCIVGFILSLFSFFVSLYLVVPILALIFSIAGVASASKKGKKLKGLGVAGIVLSSISVLVSIIGLVVLGGIVALIRNLA